MPNPSIAGTERAAKKGKTYFIFMQPITQIGHITYWEKKGNLNPTPGIACLTCCHFMTTFVRFGGILNFQF